MRRSSGFTLIEMIIVITLMGCMLALVGAFMSRPFEAYQAQSRRADLVTLTTAALINMKRDIANAVPNSIRVTSSGNVTSLEMMNIFTGGRYRYTEDNDNDEPNALSPGFADSSFYTLGKITPPLSGSTYSAKSRIVVNSVDTARLYSAAAAVAGDEGIITPSAYTLTYTADAGSNEDRIQISTPFQFDLLGSGSPRKRFYITDTPITYRCDTDAGTLYRHSGAYEVLATQSASVPTGSSSALVLNNLTWCNIEYSAGTATRTSLVTIALGVTIGGEQVRMIQQLQVNNAP